MSNNKLLAQWNRGILLFDILERDHTLTSKIGFFVYVPILIQA